MNREFTRIKADKTAMACRSIICGVGINDAWYMIETTAGGKTYYCGYYQRWVAMIRRCYSKKTHKRYPTYKDCTVCDEWLLFSSFLKWIDGKDVYGMNLDKDIKVPGNRIYGPDTCLVITRQVNNLLGRGSNPQKKLPTGVSFNKIEKRYIAQCSCDGKKTYLGSFKTLKEAIPVYAAAKKKEIIRVSKLYPDIEQYIAQHADLIQEPV